LNFRETPLFTKANPPIIFAVDDYTVADEIEKLKVGLSM